MPTFTWDGATFEIVERPTVAETRATLKWLGDDPNAFDALVGTVAVSIKRARPTFKLADVDTWDTQVITGIVEEIQAQAPATPDQAGDAAEPAGEDEDPLAGVPEEELTPSSVGSDESEQLPTPPHENATA